MRARVVASIAAVTAGAVPRASSASAGRAARSTSVVAAPRPASRASAYSTSARDLDVADGLPDRPTTVTRLVGFPKARETCRDGWRRARAWRAGAFVLDGLL